MNGLQLALPVQVGRLSYMESDSVTFISSVEAGIPGAEEELAGRFNREGFVVLEKVIPEALCESLSTELTSRFQARQISAGSRIGGLRNLLQSCEPVAEIASSAPLRNILRAALGADAFPVRSIFFDKTAQANWSVAWHQDLHIALAEKIDSVGFGPWTMKGGVPHVQPPLAILNTMATIRLHLDDCDESNGALKVIAGSHAHGILSDSEAAEWTMRQPTICEVSKGGVMLMRPLILHASSPAVNPAHRRVLHIEYAIGGLPNGLRWYERK